MAGIELKSGEDHSSYTCSVRKEIFVSQDQSLGNWLMIQNIDSQIAERMIFFFCESRQCDQTKYDLYLALDLN
jgi:hypothetical protein